MTTYNRFNLNEDMKKPLYSGIKPYVPYVYFIYSGSIRKKKSYSMRIYGQQDIFSFVLTGYQLYDFLLEYTKTANRIVNAHEFYKLFRDEEYGFLDKFRRHFNTVEIEEIQDI